VLASPRREREFKDMSSSIHIKVRSSYEDVPVCITIVSLMKVAYCVGVKEGTFDWYV
jgi:hypothetical protein